jgi:sugar-phosphatase
VHRLKAVIFDMDGLLIDTEPIWRRAEIEEFGRVGLRLTEEQAIQTMGVRVSEVVELRYRQHPWNGPSREEVTRRIEEAVIRHIVEDGEAQAGVYSALQTARDAGLPVAIASSSSLEMIEAVVRRLGIGEYVDLVCSAVDEPAGKPHPAVYLTTARRLGAPPEACLALEDSPNGVLSAKAAGMRCIVVPDPFLADDPRMDEADVRLDSLEDFTPQLLATLETDTGG